MLIGFVLLIVAAFLGASLIDRAAKRFERSRLLRARVAWAWGERGVTR
jgi:hypothetical protein